MAIASASNDYIGSSRRDSRGRLKQIRPKAWLGPTQSNRFQVGESTGDSGRRYFFDYEDEHEDEDDSPQPSSGAEPLDTINTF